MLEDPETLSAILKFARALVKTFGPSAVKFFLGKRLAEIEAEIARIKRQSEIEDAEAEAEIALIEAEIMHIKEESKAKVKKIRERGERDSPAIVYGEEFVGAEVTSQPGPRMQRWIDNSQSIAEKAAKYLEGKKVSNDETDPNWVSRFFEEVKDVPPENDDVQEIFARILAGEIENPGQISFDALSILKNMTKEDAHIFKHIANHAIGTNYDFWIYYDEESYNVKHAVESIDFVSRYYVSGAFNMRLLQNINPEIVGGFGWEGESEQMASYGNHILKIVQNQGVPFDFDIPCINISRPGRELLNVIGEFELNLRYLGRLSRFLHERNASLYYAEKIQGLADEDHSWTLVEPD